MAESCDYGCATLPDHQQVTCNEWRNGGIQAYSLFECDAEISDYTNAEQWQAAIDDGTAKVVIGITGEIPEASPAMMDNPIGEGAAQIVIGFDNTFTCMDSNVNSNNDDFYTKSNQRKMMLAVFNSINDEIRVSAQPVTIVAIPVVVPKGERNAQSYKVTCSFFTKTGVIPFELHDAPSGIFQ